MDNAKTALITGASRGIGAAIARALARDGFDLWLNYRSDHEAAAAVQRSVEEAGRRCKLLPFDVADGDAVKAALEPALEEEVPFALVNNAGFARDALLVWMSQQEWRDVLAVHLDGFYSVTKLVVAAMLRKRRGRIVNVVSTSGQSGIPGQVNYSAAKAGLIGATKALAAEVAKRNILVNAVSPGFIETDMTKNLPLDRILPMIPLGRLGTPEEAAGAVAFLCSDRATYITGQVIAVNGGTYM
ncbi:MAG: 3-oxoacyl-ACP reductase FabG [Deltaproteobacteria bacterium]|nr:3-oxoacyl-ACP reductase FabG [Deltaproteobacteria bacterium]